MPLPKVLIVEDEENILAALQYNLQKENYSVATATDGVTGLELAHSINPDLIILDIMMPRLSGLEVCKAIRKENNTPIILLTAKSDEIDKVIGLELGADDYVSKPFSMRELLARVKALLRRANLYTDRPNVQSQIFRQANLALDLKAHSATIDESPLWLTPTEFAVMSLLISNVGQAFTREQISSHIWGYHNIGDIRTVDVHIRSLRKKIEVEPSDPKRIVTVRGVGYRFEA